MLRSIIPCHHTDTIVIKKGTMIRYNDVDISKDSPCHNTSATSPDVNVWSAELHNINTTFATINISSVSR